MNFEVRIDCGALFNECIDQTLIDNRARTTQTGQSITAALALEPSLRDTFLTHLQTVAEALRARIACNVAGMLCIPDLMILRLDAANGPGAEPTAMRIKDALKCGMLAWWYGGKDAPLFQYYQARFENELDELRSTLIGTHTQRPYRML